MSFFLTSRFFYLCAALITGFVVAFFLPWLLGPMQLLLGAAGLLTLLDALLLYAPGRNREKPMFGRRVLGDKLSNGDDNEVRLYLESRYRFGVQVEVIDEIPHQFQRRDVLFAAGIAPGRRRLSPTSCGPPSAASTSLGP